MYSSELDTPTSGTGLAKGSRCSCSGPHRSSWPRKRSTIGSLTAEPGNGGKQSQRQPGVLFSRRGNCARAAPPAKAAAKDEELAKLLDGLDHEDAGGEEEDDEGGIE